MNRFIRKTKKTLRNKKTVLKRIGLLSVFVVVMGLFISKVFATNSTYELAADPTSYERGDEVLIDIFLNTSEEWSTAAFTISYDTDVFDDNESYYTQDLKAYDKSDLSNAIKKNLKVVETSGTGRQTVTVNAATNPYEGGIYFGTLELKVRDDAPSGVSTVSFQMELDDGRPATLLKDADKNTMEFLTQPLDITVLVPVESHDIDKSEINLDINKKPTDKINLVYEPEDTTDLPNASFVPADPSVVTVDTNGNVSAVGVGTTTITVTEFERQHTVPVTVTAELIGIELDSSNLELAKDGTHTYTVTTNPSPTTDVVTYNWSSSDPLVASVTNGVVTAHKGGTATITATAVINDQVSTIKATCAVSVVVPFNNVYANPDSITLTKGSHDSETINVVYEPTDATQTKSVSWSASPEGIVSVNNGVVTAIAKGDAVVTGTVAGVTPFTVNVHVDVPISTFSVSPETSDLYIGQEQTITPTFTPAKSEISENTNITWTSSPTGIVSIDENGKITALAEGTTTVTATTGTGGRLTDTVNVTVYTPISGITLSDGDFTLYTNVDGSKTKTLTATINPTGAGMENDRAINWGTSASNVATVSNGVVTAVGNGTATITATLVSNPEKTASVEVTVKTKVKGFSITNDKDVTIEKGSTHEITTQITPSTASDKTITWETGKASIATVNADGVVTAAGNGTTTITGTVDGMSDSITVHVVTSATSVTITEGSSIDLEKNHTTTLHASALPGDTTDEIVWSSNKTDTVSINSETGAITALKAGKATITATAGSKSASIEVNVVVPATGLTITDNNITLNKDSYRTLTTVLEPSDTTDTISWSSDPTSVATVDENGKVTAVGTGDATITATINGISKTATVHVILPATGITIDGVDPLVLQLGATGTLTAQIEPSGSTDSINWTCEPAGVITINNSGEYEAVGTGTTTVTATVGSVHDTMTVRVILSATSVTITEGDSIDINKNTTQKLHATIAPDGSTDTLSWSSSDQTVATIDNDGTVHALKAGHTTITAQAGTKSDTITVNVKVPTSSITITDGDSLEMIKGQEKTLGKTISPTDSTDTITWSSEPTSTVTVDENGKIVAVGTGDAVVTVTAGGKTDSINVHVVLPATNVTIAGDEEITIHRGGNQQLSATVEPTGTTDNLVWVSDNTSVATVDSTGRVTALAKGTAHITARAGTKTDRVTVTVDAPITAFTSSETNISIVKGKTKSLTYTITPNDTTDPTNITWESDSTSKVEVDSTGKITAKAQGTAHITATLGSRSIVYTVEVTIIPLEGITLNKDSLEVLKGQTDTSLSYTVTPEDTTEASTSVTWESDAPEHATVDENGHVTGISAGTANITVTMGSFSDTVAVTVTEVHLTGITLEKSSDTVEIGDKYQIKVLKEPSNSTDEVTFTYTSSDEEIATVDENGIVKGKKTGSVKITIKSSVGDYETELELNVVIPTAPANPKTGVESTTGYLIVSIMSLFGTIIIAKKRFN